MGEHTNIRIGVCGAPESIPVRPKGLDYIEGTVGDLLRPREPEEAFAARLAAVRGAAVPAEAVNCFLPGDLKTTGPTVDVAALDAYVTTALARAQRMGLKVVVFGSGGSRSVPEGFPRGRAEEQLVEHLKRWAAPATAAGVMIVLEPLNRAECNIVTSVDEASEVVRRVGHPAVRVLFDTYHMAKDGEGPDGLRRAGALLAHGHCAEADGRGPLGTVGEDQRHYFRALKDAGYRGAISIEARWSDLAAQVGPAVAELRRQIRTA